MSWTCKLVDIVGTKMVNYDPPLKGGVCGKTFFLDSKGNEIDLKDLPVGSMFYVPKDADMTVWPWYLADATDLSHYYYDHNSSRQPLFVLLPGHTLFLVDGKCWRDGKKYGGWEVSGIAPIITVHPSIHIHGFFHGFIRNGVISDDVDGRTF